MTIKKPELTQLEKDSLLNREFTIGSDLVEINLTDDAIILDIFYEKNTTISSSIEAVEKGYDLARKNIIRNKILEIGDDKSFIGTISDAASYAIDNITMDTLALSNSADSSYKKERISLFEKLHGVNSFANAVIKSQEWFDKRVSKEIILPIDNKGVERVFNDLATRGHAVASILKG
ncbi:MAG: hypothetical protein Q9M50_14140 [Methylococcales bacterium]|nr:hypothetical protein [Methylococcales bacterium]